jgi:hypothetical protein
LIIINIQKQQFHMDAMCFFSTPCGRQADYWANPALNLAPFSRWTLRDKAAQRRLALR